MMNLKVFFDIFNRNWINKSAIFERRTRIVRSYIDQDAVCKRGEEEEMM